MEAAQALWITDVGVVEVREETLPKIKSNQVRINGTYSAISLGTEKLVFNGSVPLSLHSMMSVPYQKGSFTFPIKYGYSLVGTVVDATEQEFIGRNVQLLHPHQDRTVVRSNDIFLLPEDVKLTDAAHISNLETAINSIWDAEISLGERILIVGFGTIGSLVGLILKSMNMYDVLVTDVNIDKLHRAKLLGLDVVNIGELKELKDSFDVSIHCSGTNAGLQLAIDAIGFESRCIDLSWYGINDVSLNLGETFHPLRKKIIASQVSNIPNRMQVRWDHLRRKELAIKLLSKNILSQTDQKIISFSNILDEYPRILNHDDNSIQTLIRY